MVGTAADAVGSYMLAGLACYHFIPFVGRKDTYPFDDDIIDSFHFIGFNEVRYIRRFDNFIGRSVQTYLRFIGSDIPIDGLLFAIACAAAESATLVSSALRWATRFGRILLAICPCV